MSDERTEHRRWACGCFTHWTGKRFELDRCPEHAHQPGLNEPLEYR